VVPLSVALEAGRRGEAMDREGSPDRVGGFQPPTSGGTRRCSVNGRMRAHFVFKLQGKPLTEVAGWLK
jgi:hypothetical protein